MKLQSCVLGLKFFGAKILGKKARVFNVDEIDTLKLNIPEYFPNTANNGEPCIPRVGKIIHFYPI